MNFELEPWETPNARMPTKAQGYGARIDARWRDRQRTLLLKSIRARDFYCVFAREQDCASIGNWLLVQRRRDRVSVWSTEAKPPLDLVAAKLAAGKIELARFSVVSDGKQTRRALTLPGGESLWLAANMGEQEPFDIAIEDHDFYRDGSISCETIGRELSIPDSDARFAANWLRWKKQKKQRHIFGAARLREIQTLMISFLQSRSALHEDHEDNRWWIWDLAAWGNQPSAPYNPNRIARIEEPEAALFLTFSRLLIGHFQNSFDDSLLSEHRCVKQFANVNAWPQIEYKSVPTSHEQLEARLLLRDWLQQHAPDQLDLIR